MSNKKLTKEQENILRQALFVPCDSKAHLHQWIKVYLGLDIPDCIVCDDDQKNPSSNSSPMDLIWEIYGKARDGKDHNFTQILGFAARDSFKTLSSAVMETLCLLHLKRDVGHMAALEAQAKNCQRYIEGFFKRPILKEFVTSKNKRVIEVTRYENQATGEIVSPVQWQVLGKEEREQYEEKVNWMKIVIATVDDANGLHVPFFVCVDEKTKLILQTPEDNSRVNRLFSARKLFNRIAKDQQVGDFDCIIKPLKEFKVKSLSPVTWRYEYKNILAAKRSTAFLHAWVIFEDNEEFHCTREHLFFTKNGYKQAKDLTDQDEVAFENRKFYEWKIKVPVILNAPQLKGYEGNRCKKCRRVFTLMIRDTQEYICEEPFCQAVKFGRLRFKKVSRVNLYKKEKTVYDFTIEDNHNYLANSYVVHNCDELDLADPAAFEESKMIPTMNKDGGELPITFLTSTRKYSFGLVQKEIDNSHNSNLKIRHWNIIDVTEPCPPERHLPNEPKIPIYYSNSTLKAISESDWNLLADKEKEQFEAKEGFAGCLSQCKLFAQCSGRLATKQKSRSKLLKPIEHVQALFDKVSVDHAKAQLMCFGEETQIMMSDGIQKNIKDVSIGDEVITHTGQKSKVTNVFERDFDGKIIEITHPTKLGKWAPTKVSMEHPYFINGNEFKEIKDLNLFAFNKQGNIKNSGDYFSFPMNYNCDTKKEFEYFDFVEKNDKIFKVENGRISRAGGTSSSRSIPYKFVLNQDLGWIIGFFLAEGHFSRRQYKENGKTSITCITFSSDDRELSYHQKIRDFAKYLGLTTSESKSRQSSHGFSQDIYSSVLSPLFLSFCGEYSDKKRIHPILMDGPIDFLKGILDGFYCGDGTKKFTSLRENTTTSYFLASQLFLIAGRLGLCPRIKKANKEIDRKQVYRVCYQNPEYVPAQKRTKFKIYNQYNQYRITDNVLKYKKFNGKLYNFEVHGDNSYIADGVAVHNCWKPSSEGLIYPNFNRQIHMLTPNQIFEKITGETIKETLTKANLIRIFQDMQAHIYSGLDWGFTHNFAVVTAASVNHNLFIFDCISVKELETEQKVELCKQKIKYLHPIIYPDSAYPADIATFKRHGFKMMSFKKDVLGGIEATRARIAPASGQEPSLYLLKDDPGCELLASLIIQYHWKIDNQGNLTDEPDKSKEDDLLDGLRYLCQNVTLHKTAMVADFGLKQALTPQYTRTSWVKDVLSEINQEDQTDPIIGGNESDIQFII